MASSIEQCITELVADMATLSIEDSVLASEQLKSSMKASIHSYRCETVTSGPHQTDVAYSLASTLQRYHAAFDNVDYLQESITIYQSLLGPNPCIPPVSGCLSDILDDLGESLRLRFEQFGAYDDLDNSIELHETALELRSSLGLDTARSLAGIGLALYTKGYGNGMGSYWERSIEMLHRVLLLPIPDDIKYASMCYLSLALASMTGKSSTFKPAAIMTARDAMRVVPPGHLYHGLAAIAALKAIMRSDIRVVNASPAYRYTSVLAERTSHPYRVMTIICSCFDVFHGPVNDVTIPAMTETLDTVRHMHESCHPGHILFRNLGRARSWALDNLYRITGRLEMLDEDVAVCRALVIRVTGNTPSRSLLHSFSYGLLQRYQVAGRIEDLEQAIAASEQCVALNSPVPHEGELMYTTGLAGALVVRSRDISSSTDLERALRLFHQFLSVASSLDFYDDFTWAQDMAEACLLSHRRGSLPPQTLEAIKVLRLLLPRITHTRHIRDATNGLATLLRLLGSSQRASQHILEAITIRRSIISAGADSTPDQSQSMADLALDYMCLWKIDSRPEDLRIAMQCFSDAVRNTFSSPLSRLRHALLWCESAAEAGAETIGDAFGQAVSLLPNAFLFGGDMKARLAALKFASTLSSDAGMHILCTSGSLSAVCLLEQARAIFWAHMLRSRQSIDHLQSSSTVKSLTNTLRALDMVTDENTNLLTHRRNLLEKYDQLLHQCQSIPGFRDILQPLSSDRLFEAARNGPIVILLSSATAAGCIIIRSATRSLVHLPLHGVATDIVHAWNKSLDIENRQTRDILGRESRKLVTKPHGQRYGRTYEAALEKMWDLIVCPVVHTMDLQRIKVDDRPRIFWCPTGAFTFLPLHAAGRYSIDRSECTSNCMISSYAPTVTSLLNAHENKPIMAMGSKDTQILVSAVPNAPGHAPLPNTVAEARLIARLLPEATILEGDVTVDQFLAGMSSATFVHLACHGKQDLRDPLDSGFAFNDGIATLSSLMGAKVNNACFAFLSACESAMGDKNLPDEAIHMAAAMFFMGYRSVIGTLWSMHDADGPRVAQRVYSEILKNKETFNYDVVPRALDAVVRELRDEGVHPSRWATWIHMGI